jgi:hypothetical protein
MHFLLAIAEKEHCGIWSILVISADRDVHEEEISPITPTTPSCINEMAEKTAWVMAA